MAATKVKYVMSGPYKGKDFAPRNHPNFQFVKGVFEATVDAAGVPAMDRILGGYGATRTDAADESKPAAKAPAKKKTTAKKPAAKKAEVKKDAATTEEGSTDDKVQSDGEQSEQGDSNDGGSNDDPDAGEAGNAASEQDGAGSENEEEMI